MLAIVCLASFLCHYTDRYPEHVPFSSTSQVCSSITYFRLQVLDEVPMLCTLELSCFLRIVAPQTALSNRLSSAVRCYGFQELRNPEIWHQRFGMAHARKTLACIVLYQTVFRLIKQKTVWSRTPCCMYALLDQKDYTWPQLPYIRPLVRSPALHLPLLPAGDEQWELSWNKISSLCHVAVLDIFPHVYGVFLVWMSCDLLWFAPFPVCRRMNRYWWLVQTQNCDASDCSKAKF